MNPLTNMKNVLKLSEHELKNSAGSKSWHDMYHDSAWIFAGGLPYMLTEGDIICVFSQYGEVVNLNLARDKTNGKSKGFCFVCYEDQRSTILAVDNLNGIKILGRSLRVDHVANYKPPAANGEIDEKTLQLHMEGCAPKPQITVCIKEERARSRDPKVLYKIGTKTKRKKSKTSKKHKIPMEFRRITRSSSRSFSSESSSLSVKRNNRSKRARK